MPYAGKRLTRFGAMLVPLLVMVAAAGGGAMGAELGSKMRAAEPPPLDRALVARTERATFALG